MDNSWVVPYNRDLLVRYQCHMNVEVCNQGRVMKYLFKYCLKGSDRATVLLKSKSNDQIGSGQPRIRDEIQMFIDGR